MNNAVRVGVFQRSAQLFCDFDSLSEGGYRGLAQRLAFDQLKYDEGPIVRFASIVHRHDVGVIEFGDGAGFAQQARLTLRAECGAADHFDGYGPIEHGVIGTIDCAHAALAEFSVESIAVLKECADHHLPPLFAAIRAHSWIVTRASVS